MILLLGHHDPLICHHLIFFLWGHLQPIIYAIPIQNMEHLKQQIHTACEVRYDSIVRAINTIQTYYIEQNCASNKMDFNSKICCEFFTKSFPFQLLKVELNVISSLNNKHNFVINFVEIFIPLPSRSSEGILGL